MSQTIELRASGEGVILPVRAQAGARRTCLRGIQAGALKVAVAQAPERGKANDAIVRLLCDQLGLKRNQLELIAGASSPRKRFLVRGISLEELRQRVAEAADGAK